MLLILLHPGEKGKFDWGKVTVRINNSDKRLFIAVFTLPFSNYRKAYIYQAEDGYSFTKAFKEFIKDINGVPPILLTDNMRIARAFNPKNTKDKVLTKLFSDLSEHYGFEVEFCNPRCPNEKGGVENGVKVIKSELLSSYINSFNSIEELQEFVSGTFDRLHKKKHFRKNDTCINLMKHEMSSFKPLPKSHYVYYQENTRKVNNKGEISFKNNRYLIREDFRGETVNIKYNKAILYILSKDNEILAKYTLSGVKLKKYLRIWYCKNKPLEKPNGFINSEEYRSLPKWLKTLYHNTCLGDPIAFANLLYKLNKKPKNTIYKLSRRKNISIESLTLEELNNFLE